MGVKVGGQKCAETVGALCSVSSRPAFFMFKMARSRRQKSNLILEV